MINKIKTAYSIAINALKYLFRIPVNKASLFGGTLKQSDIQLVKKLLNASEEWEEEAITRYEKSFSEKNGSEYAFSFRSGRVALGACLKALNLKKGDEILIPGYTCIAVANAVWFEGLIPVFCDIELDTYGLDIQDLIGKHQQHPKAKAILLHHLYGLVCRDYMEIIDFAKSHSLAIIEDCAHSFGAEFKGVKVGNYGDVAFYSTEQSKVYSTFMGGMAVTNSGTLAESIKRFQLGLPFPPVEETCNMLKNVLLIYYQNAHPYRGVLAPILGRKLRKFHLPSVTEKELKREIPPGYWTRFPVPLAELGLSQLKEVDRFNAQRREAIKSWERWCDDHGFKKPLVIPGSTPVFLRYPVMVKDEMKKNKSWSNGLEVVIGDWFKSNLHPVEYSVSDCPNANRAVQCCINFPTLLE